MPDLSWNSFWNGKSYLPVIVDSVTGCYLGVNVNVSNNVEIRTAYCCVQWFSAWGIFLLAGPVLRCLPNKHWSLGIRKQLTHHKIQGVIMLVRGWLMTLHTHTVVNYLSVSYVRHTILVKYTPWLWNVSSTMLQRFAGNWQLCHRRYDPVMIMVSETLVSHR